MSRSNKREVEVIDVEEVDEKSCVEKRTLSAAEKVFGCAGKDYLTNCPLLC